ncbi:alpha-D-ribose 1-methylphosphonate 5-triphosphate diphosphatase [Oceanicola sp. 502str15]|uniref:alpha-D-ribose 1-methylphosphonate 5-triphosphate diphosphatase n=1 Tax=Oceanicola sp. 502str15 TaxID=2696061 RepID=UPI0020947C63|nr:alpha-D-ribose 1-methylphosphonate 5-triphosphate diphosphatase [Oceanicola sp. 502str15]MCO6383475.1 alpha-D-ribose 1-methylphosphonate 5-triphosphate diphosphatase [Oceanicola sp. 502str15]
MAHPLPPLRLTGGQVLTGPALEERALTLADGILTDGNAPEVDLSGYLVLPGIIDLHGDGFEHQIAPRASAQLPLGPALLAADREAAANGVTTLWLAQGWGWEGGRRSPEFAEELMAALAQARPSLLTDMRVQLRCETHMPDSAERMLAAIRCWGVDYVVFNNHLPEAEHRLAEQPQALASWAEKRGQTVEAFTARIQAARSTAPRVPRHLCTLAGAFDEIGVRYGSHDDPDGETRERMHILGATICEFPTREAAAKVARANGDPVLMGAPNVVRGGSQSGGVSALSLVTRGLCDALVSDYHLPCLPAAAWALADMKALPFATAWELISTRPAAIMGLHDRGHLSPGKRADLVVMHPQTRQIEATIAGGQLAHLSGALALRVLARPEAARALAAE